MDEVVVNSVSSHLYNSLIAGCGRCDRLNRSIERLLSLFRICCHDAHPPWRYSLRWSIGPSRTIASTGTFSFCWQRDADLPPYQVASWSIQPFRHTRHGPKSGGAVPLCRGAESPFNTTLPGPRPTSVPNSYLRPSSRLATTDIGRKLGAVPLWGSWVSM